MVSCYTQAVLQSQRSSPRRSAFMAMRLPATHLHHRLKPFLQSNCCRNLDIVQLYMAMRYIGCVAKPLRSCAFFLTSCPSALMGGPSYCVTAGFPLAMTFSRLLPLFISSYLLLSQTSVLPALRMPGYVRGKSLRSASRDVDQFLGGRISESFSSVPSCFILSTIRYVQEAQSTSLLTSHLPDLVPPQRAFHESWSIVLSGRCRRSGAGCSFRSLRTS